jgi:hypothetical protein
MRRIATLITTLALAMSGFVVSPAQAKAKVAKPSAPTVSAVSSSTPKKGKVNVTVTITLPASNGGSKITGSKVTAGGKTCTIKKTKTSCTIKSIKNGKLLSVYANSKNIKGFGSKSTRVAYIAGASAWPAAPVVSVVADTPAASSPAAAPAPLTCATGGTCVVGDRGPGGGIVYYVDNAGFNCGSGFTATGSPTGGLCQYLEVAPRGWNGTDADPRNVWATTAYQYTDVTDIADDLYEVNNTRTGIGLGLKNSMAIVAQGNDNTTAAGAARAYRGSAKDDWYLPTSAELNLLCQWSRNVTQVVGTACTGGTLNTGTGANGGMSISGYWSSSEGYGTVYYGGGAGSQWRDDKHWPYGVRPVRAF